MSKQTNISPIKNSTGRSYSTAVNNLVVTALFTVLVGSCFKASAQPLYNVDFGGNASVSTKSGYAATGQSSSDYWNFYTRDDGFGGWRTYGAMSNIKLANGVTTGVGLTVNNAPGFWIGSSADPMYNKYIYPFGGVATVTLTGLSLGNYDLYVYGYDGNYNLNVGSTAYGNKTSFDPNFTIPGSPVWQEGVQYVRYGGLTVNTGDDLSLTVQNGIYGAAVIAGFQLVQVPEPTAFSIVLAVCAVRGFLFLKNNQSAKIS